MNANAPNFDQFSKQIDDWLRDAETLAVHVARGLSAEVFELVLQMSPQYSGDFAGNWKYSVGSPDRSFSKLGLMTKKRSHDTGPATWSRNVPFITGSILAIKVARTLNAGEDLGLIRLGQTAYISNSAYHTDAYAWEIENNEIMFRAGNYGMVGVRVFSLLDSKYAGGIGKIDAIRLSRMNVGDWV